MLDHERIDTALQRMADAFLLEPRAATSALSGVPKPGELGWGQFLSQHGATQVGLYGTCAGVIAISLGYGGNRIPSEVVEYLRDLWANRDDTSTKGPRYFSLTLRLAFFYLALRLANRADLRNVAAEVDQELQGRTLGDLWIDWKVDGTRSQVGSDFATAAVILAYTLPVRGTRPTNLPSSVVKGAHALQVRLKSSDTADLATTRLQLCAVVSALPKKDIARPIRRLVRAEIRRPDTYQLYALRFVDYQYAGSMNRVESRRDYSVMPSAAIEVLIASGYVSTPLGKLRALRHAEWLWSKTAGGHGSFFSLGQGVLTASKDQAWVALALEQSRVLLHASTPLNRALFRIQRFDLLWRFVLPISVLAFSALVSFAPGSALVVLKWMSVTGSSVPWWWSYASPIVQVLGIALLAAWGQSLGKRLFGYVRGKWF